MIWTNGDAKPHMRLNQQLFTTWRQGTFESGTAGFGSSCQASIALLGVCHLYSIFFTVSSSESRAAADYAQGWCSCGRRSIVNFSVRLRKYADREGEAGEHHKGRGRHLADAAYAGKEHLGPVSLCEATFHVV